jgi:hypothetical protein
LGSAMTAVIHNPLYLFLNPVHRNIVHTQGAWPFIGVMEKWSVGVLEDF